MIRRTSISLFLICILAAMLLTNAYAQNEVDPYFEKIDFANGLFQRGLYDMAASEYGEFLKQYPDSSHAHEAVFGMGESFFFTQDYAKATQYYKDYVSQFANRDKIHLAQLRLAQCLVAQEQYDSALEAVNGIGEKGLEGEWLQKKYLVTGQILQAKKEDDAAIAVYGKISAIDPASTPALEAFLKLGEIYKGRGDYPTAVDYFQAATKHAQDKAFKGIALYKQAETAFLSADYEISADLFAEVVDLQPDPALVEDAISNLLLALFNVPAYNAVVKRAAYYEKLLTPKGRLFDVRYVSARSLKQLGQYDAALEEISKAEAVETITPSQKNKAKICSHGGNFLTD